MVFSCVSGGIRLTDFKEILLSHGTEVNADNEATNATVVVHTVTADRTLYVDCMTVEYSCRTIAGVTGALQAYNAVPALVYELDKQQFNVVAEVMNCGNSLTFPLLLQIPAGYSVRVYSSGASFTVYGYVHGYEL